jgi:hypothetical protein
MTRDFDSLILEQLCLIDREDLTCVFNASLW